MSRQDYIFGSDGLTRPDDLIPRCAPNGGPQLWNEPTTLRTANMGWTPAFSSRVADAMHRLTHGESPSEVRERHGAIVVRQAMAELVPGARIVAK